MVLATLGKGHKPREEGKDGFLRGALGLEAAPVCWEALAKGDETKGRGEIIANEATIGKSSVNGT